MGMLKSDIAAFGTAIKENKSKIAGIILYEKDNLMEDEGFVNFIEDLLYKIDKNISTLEKYYVAEVNNYIIIESVLKVKLLHENQLVIFKNQKLIFSVPLKELYEKYKETIEE